MKSATLWSKTLIVAAILLISVSPLLVGWQIPARADDSTVKVNRATGNRENNRVGVTVHTLEFPFRDDKVPFNVAVWYPTDKAESKHVYKIGPSEISTRLAFNAPVQKGKFPIVFYAHGATGAGTSSFFVCETLARHGYIVVAPDFLDDVFVARINEKVPLDNFLLMRTAHYISWLREVILNKSAADGRRLNAYRPEQLHQVMERAFAANRDPENFLYHHIDEEKIGLVGHSFGAWTSLLLAGASEKYFDKRIKAVVALSGPVNKFVYAVDSENDLAAVKVPVLFEYGQKETALGRQDDKSLLFDKSHSPKMLISIKDADHLSFSGGVRGEHKTAEQYITNDSIRRTISETTRDFFDIFLKGEQIKCSKLKERTDGIESSLADFSAYKGNIE